MTGVSTALAKLKEMSRQAGFKVLVFGPMSETVCGICRELDIPYTNTYETIPTDKYPESYRIHFMHPSKDGYRVLAEYLERDLDRRGWLTPREK